MPFKSFLGEVLCIVYSEIAYYRYLFPEYCFETVRLVDTVSHRLIKGKSIESDQLLETIDGVCDALSKELIKTLVIGISISPIKPTYVRELYAFQFGRQQKSNATVPVKSAKKKLLSENATTALFLDRLVGLLREMEPLAPPISIGSRMALVSNASAEYIPPSFLPFSTSSIEGFTILPHCGSARIGKAERDGLALYMCALCVEGAVQVPTLGSILCAMPMSLDVDEDMQETVFVASPGWVQCLEQAKDIKDRLANRF
ncbi:hypothetical protein LPJ64_002762 [Coemansia asiatica]|uniref:HORMA domain-containing protein n=1 Tax=Coemansia asiatica TaxID=1052880 RepID=A0A9W8CKN0_9FUNG|nr:hypothetical protein LPJ64_002762 [Coemansia asiatica]